MAELPDHDELLQAVRSAGWLLEHHAVRVLEELGMHPRPGWAYQDPDEPTKSRELDVWSYRQLLHDEVTKVMVTARFLVECKQSANPYVGVGRTFPQRRFRENPTQHTLPMSHVGVDVPGQMFKSNVPAWTALGFELVAADHGDTNFRVTQLTRLDREKGGIWSASNSAIFTSLVYPLAKALRASQGRPNAWPAMRVPDGRKRTGWLDFGLHFPVVLISCPLYVIDATDSELVIEERPWVTAVRDLKSQNTSGWFEFDIVTEQHFSDYVKARLSFATSIAELVRENPLEYTGEDKLPE